MKPPLLKKRKIFLREPEDYDKSPIGKLNDKFCRRWRKIDEKLWSKIKIFNLMAKYRQHRKLDITTEQDGEEILMKNIENVIIHKILSRCGPYISEVILDFSGGMKNSEILTILAKHCHNIQTLELSYINDYNLDGLEKLLINNEKIESLHLEKCTDRISGMFIYLRGRNLKSLMINSSLRTTSSADKLNSFIMTAAFLENVSIDFFNLETMDVIKKKPTLKFVGLPHLFPKINEQILSIPNEFMKLISLKNLKRLDVSDGRHGVNDNFSREIAKNCKRLKILEINGQVDLTTAGICSFLSLPLLEELWCANVSAMDDYALGHVRETMIEMDVSKCSVTDAGLIPLLRRSRKLWYLDISDNNITDATLAAAVDSVECRSNNVALNLHLGSNNRIIDISRFLGRTPRLFID